MCNSNCRGHGCGKSRSAKYLVVAGGVNWGLIGLGMLFSQGDWNVIGMLLGSVMWLEAVVYVLVGVAAVGMIFGCKCKTCKTACESCKTDGGSDKMEGNM